MKKNNVFLCISNVKNIFFIILAVIIAFACIITPIAVLSSTKTYTYTVVIDAGHGGLDVK